MKKQILSLLACSLLIGTANADFEEMVHGKVLTVEPLTQTVYHRVPQQTCSVTQIQDRQIEKCQNYYDSVYHQKITGYRVKFEYRGTVQTVVLRNDPGAHVSMRSVTKLYVLE